MHTAIALLGTESAARARTRAEARRASGAFDTPWPIALRLVAEAYRGLALDAADLPRLLDPACGTGAVLLAAFCRLSRRFPGVPAGRLLASLHGTDCDRDAVDTARRVLAHAAAVHETARGHGATPAHASRAGAVRNGPGDADEAASREAVPRLRLADALHGPLRPEYDLVVGNPPWVSLAGKHRARGVSRVARQACIDRLGADTYRPNLFELFVRATLLRLRPGGRQVFLVPDRLARNRQFERLRRELVAAHRIRLLEFGLRFDGVDADTLLYRIDAGRPTARAVVRVRDARRPGETESRVPQRAFAARPGCPFWFVRGRGLAPLIDRLLRWPVRLGERVSSHTGFIAAAGRVTSTAPIEADGRPVLKGAHVRAWAVQGEAWLRTGPGALAGGTQDARLLDAGHKVLVPKTGLDLRAAPDATGRWPEQSLYFLLAPRAEDRELALGLLNSRLARVLYEEAFVTNRDSLPHLKKMDLDQLPWPADDDADPTALLAAIRVALRDSHDRGRPAVDAAIEAHFRVTQVERAALRTGGSPPRGGPRTVRP